MSFDAEPAKDVRRADAVLLSIAAACFLLEFLPSLNRGYGYFIDELYYIACSKHVALGYVDHPPASIFLLWLVRSVAGNSLLAMRAVAALAGAGTVVVTGLIARRLGAGLFGQALAALTVATCTIYQVIFGFYSMNALSLLLWAACFYILVEIERRGEPRYWLLFGLALGIGLENKHTIVLLGLGLAVGLLLSPARRHLARRWIWLGAGIALLVLAPNLVWQALHGWPSIEFYRNAELYKNVATPPLEVIQQQVLFMNPVAVVVWGAGLVFFLGATRGRSYRHLGWVYVVLLIVMLVGQQSRPDRLAPAYLALIAGGGAMIDAGVQRRGLRWLRFALPVLLVAASAALAPLALPILPPARAADYAVRLGIVPQIEAGEGKKTQLPQWLADRMGWKTLAADIEAAAATLSPDERAHAIVATSAYGLAGAIELFGRDLPPVYAAQNNYHLWGPPPDPVEAAVAVGLAEETLQHLFEQVEPVGLYDCDLCTPWRDGSTIYVARRPKVRWADVWPRFKSYQ